VPSGTCAKNFYARPQTIFEKLFARNKTISPMPDHSWLSLLNNEHEQTNFEAIDAITLFFRYLLLIARFFKSNSFNRACLLAVCLFFQKALRFAKS
jgi:hypothetical protein